MNNWISVKDELPKLSEPVDVWADSHRHPNFLITKRTKKDFYFTPKFAGRSIIDNATHWMRVPKAPEDECTTKKRIKSLEDLLKEFVEEQCIREESGRPHPPFEQEDRLIEEAMLLLGEEG